MKLSAGLSNLVISLLLFFLGETNKICQLQNIFPIKLLGSLMLIYCKKCVTYISITFCCYRKSFIFCPQDLLVCDNGTCTILLFDWFSHGFYIFKFTTRNSSSTTFINLHQIGEHTVRKEHCCYVPCYLSKVCYWFSSYFFIFKVLPLVQHEQHKIDNVETLKISAD
jgi:hypothetical protein